MSILKNARLVWDEKYSITHEIDEQHKHLFKIFNELVEVVCAPCSQKEDISKIIKEILEYKAIHFATEEKYFHEFNYEGTAEHEAAHKLFGEKLDEIQKASSGDPRLLAFNIIDFLEDWLLDHLMDMDQKYKKCFLDHGLK